jgi:hypothetical protein
MVRAGISKRHSSARPPENFPRGPGKFSARPKGFSGCPDIPSAPPGNFHRLSAIRSRGPASSNTRGNRFSFPQNPSSALSGELSPVSGHSNQTQNKSSQPPEKSPEPLDKLPGPWEKFPQPPDKFPEPPDKFPELSDKFPEPSDKFPEPSDKFPEPPDKFPEHADKFSETSDKFPEPRDKFPKPWAERTGTATWSRGARLPFAYGVYGLVHHENERDGSLSEE